MAKQFGADDQIKCPECGGAMYIKRQTPHPARRDYEKQTIECTKCEHSMTRTIDGAGRPLR